MTRAEAFNEWMRRYIEDPERFRREMTTVREFLAEEAAGTEPTYGERCDEYLRRLEAGELADATAPPSTAPA